MKQDARTIRLISQAAGVAFAEFRKD